MSSQNPLVSVLMPVYNGARYIGEALESILAQTYTNFEVVLINDGSTDNSEDIILSYNDSRINYIKNETNLRLIATLNKGIGLCKGKYIARMDADDVAMPERLEKQVAFMEANPDYAVCGSFVIHFGNQEGFVSFETKHDEITFRQIFSTYIRHPSAIIRKAVLDKHQLRYHPEYVHVEDHHFWIELSKYGKLAILPEALLRYRVHDENISVTKQKEQAQVETRIRQEQIARLGIEMNVEQTEAFNAFINLIRYDNNQYLKNTLPVTQQGVEVLHYLLKEIVTKNREKQIFAPTVLEKHFAKAYYKLAIHLTGFGPGLALKAINHPVFDDHPLTTKEKVATIIKALIGKQYNYNNILGLEI